MKTLEHSQQIDLLPMELPSMLLQEDSPAKILALQEGKQELVKEPGADCGASAFVLLASYDQNTQSLRTSQTCFLAHQSGQGDGLAEFSQTWPASGMMRNGKIYQRQPWALPIADQGSGLLPTPTASQWRGAAKKRFKGSPHYKGSFTVEALRHSIDCPQYANPDFVETIMGFPTKWTELKPVETL
jgi:hypothetical protein